MKVGVARWEKGHDLGGSMAVAHGWRFQRKPDPREEDLRGPGNEDDRRWGSDGGGPGRAWRRHRRPASQRSIRHGRWTGGSVARWGWHGSELGSSPGRLSGVDRRRADGLEGADDGSPGKMKEGWWPDLDRDTRTARAWEGGGVQERGSARCGGRWDLVVRWGSQGFITEDGPVVGGGWTEMKMGGHGESKGDGHGCRPIGTEKGAERRVLAAAAERGRRSREGEMGPTVAAVLGWGDAGGPRRRKWFAGGGRGEGVGRWERSGGRWGCRFDGGRGRFRIWGR